MRPHWAAAQAGRLVAHCRMPHAAGVRSFSSGEKMSADADEWLKKNPVVRCLIEWTQVRSAPQS